MTKDKQTGQGEEGFSLKKFLWQQAPLSAEKVKILSENECRHNSIRTRIVVLLAAALFTFGLICVVTSYNLYLEASVGQHIRLSNAMVDLAAGVVDPKRIEEFIEKGEDAAGYKETEAKLYRIKESSPDIRYIYVYKIMEDGCHVVFDLDAEGQKGTNPGEVEEFDEAFEPYLPTLLKGGNIEPIVSDDTYGWLLTVYKPILDSDGVCRAYAGIDISMDDIRTNARDYLFKTIIVFTAVCLLVLAVVLILAKYSIILPINTMAHVLSRFDYNNEHTMEDSLGEIRKLDVKTGDEIENLYRSLVQMTASSVSNMKDIKGKNETIAKMQYALIVTLADIVENRDENTGQHIKKTAAYTKIIMDSMKELGIYADELTDDFINNVENSAPLHDIGKISVPDAILNKPGRLTDEEFAVMKSHTTEGGKIIADIMKTLPDSGYLQEAKNLATYHHEWWNGKGYPTGKKGKDIPLSARIMAVADVFDALVSTRSYKKGFPYDKALGIIKEESGTHFDPKITEAFFAAKEDILQVADYFGGKEENAVSADDNGKKG